MPPLNPEERRRKRDHILTRVAQLLEREFRRTSHTSSLDVAKLAIELARLRSTDPKLVADEAVALLRECSRALERPAPGVWTEERANSQIMKSLVEGIETDRVPYAQLVNVKPEDSDPRFSAELEEGKQATFEPYRSEKGFILLLQDYAAGHYERHRESLAQMLASKSPKFEEAVQFVAQYANGECRDDIAAIESGFSSVRRAEEFAAAWANKACQRFVERLREEARAGTLDAATVRALLKLRVAKSENRNRKVVANRRKSRA